jgi:hypothetical protein
MDTLILEANEISSFQLLDYLNAPGYIYISVNAAHKRLEKLSLAGNLLANSLPQHVHHLTHLNMADTLISSFDYLADLSEVLPHLINLRISPEPFFRSADSSRHNRSIELVNSLMIATFPNLTHLNGSKVTDLERENSELYYLSHPPISNALSRPRYTALLQSSPHLKMLMKNTALQDVTQSRQLAQLKLVLGVQISC